MPTLEPLRNIVRRTTKQVPCLRRASMDQRKPATFFSEQGWEIPAGWKEKKNNGEKIANVRTTEKYCPQNHQTSFEQVPCLQRAKHGSKETCNLLQQAGVRDSCRLGKEKNPSGEKREMPTTEPPRNNRPQNHRTGSMFAACKAWIEGNLQPSSASRGDKFLQAGKGNKQWGKNANFRTTKKYRPLSHRTGSMFAACKNMDQREPATFFSK